MIRKESGEVVIFADYLIKLFTRYSSLQKLFNSFTPFSLVFKLDFRILYTSRNSISFFLHKENLSVEYPIDYSSRVFVSYLLSQLQPLSAR